MPLLRHSIYAQDVDIFLAPTAHATEIWSALMQTIAIEGNVFVMTATPCVRANQLPSWIVEAKDLGDQVVSRGGSMITSPCGKIVRRERMERGGRGCARYFYNPSTFDLSCNDFWPWCEGGISRPRLGDHSASTYTPNRRCFSKSPNAVTCQ